MVRTTKEFIVATKIVPSSIIIASITVSWHFTETVMATVIGPSIETFQFIADDLCFGDYAH